MSRQLSNGIDFEYIWSDVSLVLVLNVCLIHINLMYPVATRVFPFFTRLKNLRYHGLNQSLITLPTSKFYNIYVICKLIKFNFIKLV